MGAVTISTTLIAHVRQLYDMALQDLASGRVVRKGINGYTHRAIPAYIVSVSSVEAFVNEAFLTEFARVIFKDAPLWSFPVDWLENLELSTKLVIIPQLLFGKSFSRDSQPYQDIILLIKVRNHFVHYKMKHKPPKFLKSLDDRGISLGSPTGTARADYAWAHKLSCSEGIRWAHNTVCDVVKELASFDPTGKFHKGPFGRLAQAFSPIPCSYAENWLRNRGLDPHGSNG